MMLQNAEHVLLKYDECAQWYPGCVEPGYDDKPIWAADWNNVPKHVANYFERRDYELEWSDEWTSCCDCGKAIRTSPDSYSWTPHYVWVGEREIVCLDCLDPDEHLEEVMNTTDSLFRLDVSELESRGWTKYNGEYESGWYGTDDDPKKIVESLPKSADFVFTNISAEQFRMTFELYTKPVDTVNQ